GAGWAAAGTAARRARRRRYMRKPEPQREIRAAHTDRKAAGRHPTLWSRRSWRRRARAGLLARGPSLPRLGAGLPILRCRTVAVASPPWGGPPTVAGTAPGSAWSMDDGRW